MKQKMLTVLLGAMLSGSVVAAPIALPSGAIYFQFNNLEQVSLTNSLQGGTEGNWGVVNVSSMQFGSFSPSNEHSNISGGTAFFSDDGPGGAAGQIHGIFYGLNVTSPSTQTGGFLDLYWTDAGADTITSAQMNGAGLPPTIRTAQNQAGPFTAGTLLASFKFMPGVINGDNVTTVKTNVDIGVILGDPNAQGQANSYADVYDVNGDGVINSADGAWASKLNGDWFFVDNDGDGTKGEAGERRDLRFSNLFDKLTEWDDPIDGGIKGLRSNDPGRAFAIPEPTTLALLGLSTLGLLGWSSRRKAA